MLLDSAIAREQDSEDTQIVDVDAEDVMQVFVPQMNLGDPEPAWHRPFVSMPGTTACELKYHSEFSKPRRESLDQTEGKLCRRGCFTAGELREADKLLERERRATGENAPIQLREWLDDPERPRPTSPKRRK
jgi:hypothetical protein